MRAQGGDPEAIARLISRSLVARGITCRARWRDQRLVLLLESRHSVEPEELVSILKAGFQRLDMACPLTSVQVTYHRIGTEHSDWEETFALSTAAVGPASFISQDALPQTKTMQATAASVPPPPVESPQLSPGKPSITATTTDTALAALCHLMPLFSYLILLGDLWMRLPWFWANTFLLPWRMITPLLVLLVFNRNDWVRQNAREALNFQISMVIYWLITLALMSLLVGFLWAIPLALAEIIVIIVATIQVQEGRFFRYPLCIRFIR